MWDPCVFFTLLAVYIFLLIETQTGVLARPEKKLTGRGL